VCSFTESYLSDTDNTALFKNTTPINLIKLRACSFILTGLFWSKKWYLQMVQCCQCQINMIWWTNAPKKPANLGCICLLNHIYLTLTTKIERNNAKYTAIMPFKVTNFGTNQKPICDFLLVINICWKLYDHIFIRLDKTSECDGRMDGQTDRQTARSYYSGLHCEMHCKKLAVHPSKCTARHFTTL